MNLVLIGLPGCGKTTVGKIVAEKLNRPFVDCDDMIVESAGKSIPAIFALEGECWFRQRESRCLHDLLEKDGQVIATGGGVVISEENRRELSKARVVFLDRTVQDIMSTFCAEERPLMAKHTLQELSNSRRNLYLGSTDVIIREKTAESATEAIIKWWREQE